MDITGAAVVALVALLGGMLMVRFRQPAIVGYIIAGVVLGPAALGLVDDRTQIAAMAELGILMLLFVVGMELKVKRFIEVWKVATLATLAQVSVGVGVMLLARLVFPDVTFGLAVLLGFVVALSSTAVVIKILEATGERDSEAGRLAVGVLIAQDMAVAPMMLVLSAMSESEASLVGVGQALASVVFLALVVWVLLKKGGGLPFGKLVAENHDLAPLMGLAFCFGAAALAGVLGLSAAYGAFLAGLIIGNSKYSAEMMRATQPVQAILLMAFFVSVGLLVDLNFIWDNLWTVLALLLFVTVLKTLLNIGVIGLLGVPWHTAFMAGVALAQVGEFSFLLAGQGVLQGIMAPDQQQLVVAVTVLSLAASPVWQITMRRLHGAAQEKLGTFSEVLDAAYGSEARTLAKITRDAPKLTRAMKEKVAAKAQSAKVQAVKKLRSKDDA